MSVRLGQFVSDSDSAGHWEPLPIHSDARLGTRFVRLVIVESGSTGISAQAAIDHPTPIVAIAQGDGEPAASFASRVVRRILALERADQKIERTEVFLAHGSTPESAPARLTIARALITHSASALGRPPEFVLDASGESPIELESEMPALLDALIGESASEISQLAVKLEVRV
jgi:hypothetical protein